MLEFQRILASPDGKQVTGRSSSWNREMASGTGSGDDSISLLWFTSNYLESFCADSVVVITRRCQRLNSGSSPDRRIPAKRNMCFHFFGNRSIHLSSIEYLSFWEYMTWRVWAFLSPGQTHNRLLPVYLSVDNPLPPFFYSCNSVPWASRSTQKTPLCKRIKKTVYDIFPSCAMRISQHSR